MHNSKTAGTIVAEVMMVRAGGWAGLFVVVEGPEDESFWRAHLRVRPEAIVIAEGSQNLRECMRSLPADLSNSVCAIADQDFRRYLPADPFAGCQNTFFYDEGFLETFLLNTFAFRKLLGVHANPMLLSAFLRTERPATVYSYLRRIGTFIGRLRVLNERNGWGLCFDKVFSAYKYVSEANWTLDEPRLLSDVAAAIGGDPAALRKSCEQVGILGQVGLLHGHDSLKILAIGLNGRLGTGGVGPRLLSTNLRLAFESMSLSNKRLLRDLKSWAGGRHLI